MVALVVGVALTPTDQLPTSIGTPAATPASTLDATPAAAPDGLVVTATPNVHHDTIRLAPAMAGPLERAALEAELEAVAEAQRTKRVHRAEEHGSGLGSKQRDAVPMGLDVSAGPDAVRQGARPTGSVVAAPSWEGLGTRFAGWAGSGTRYAPPDTDGEVGRDHYVQVVSATMVVFDKTSGAVVYGPVSTSALWQGFGGPCELDHADAVVRYDQLADRWLIGRPTVGSKSGPFMYCLAVSASGDPAGAWYRYSYEYDQIPDYAKLSVWPDAYVVTYNMYDPTETFQGAKVCAFEREAMLAGRAARQICAAPPWGYHSLLAADVDGPTPPPAGMPVPVVSLGRTTATLAAWTFAIDWSPTGRSIFSLPQEVAVPAFAYPCGTGGACVPQPGTATILDTMGDRLMARLAYRNGGATGSLVVAHSVGLDDTSGAARHVGVRWYELETVPGAPIRLRQSGTFAPDADHRWLPSIATDSSGGIALGYTISGEGRAPSVAVTGRLADDTAGAMTRTETIAVAGAGSQTTLSGLAITRWGDYASMTVDPVDGCTFYFASEYLPSNGVFNWATGIARFRLPNCTPADGSELPGAILVGATVAPGGRLADAVTSGPGDGGAGSAVADASGGVGGISGRPCGDPCLDPGVGTLLPGRIRAVSPASAGPGAVVTIAGRDLSSATAVWFNGIRSPRFLVLSRTSVLAAVPRGATGLGRVTVTLREGTARAVARFVGLRTRVAPRIAGVSPSAGAPGTTVTITGSGLLGATWVRIGGVPARIVRFLGTTRLEVVVPALARSGSLVVMTPGGQASARGTFRVR